MNSLVKKISESHGNMKGFEAKTVAFCVGIAFGFPSSLKCGNMESYLSHPHFKLALTFTKLPF